MTHQKIVKIGMMSFGHMHAASYAECLGEISDAELVGIADSDASRGGDMATKFNTRFYRSYEELLGSGVDAVFVGSENANHRKLVELAAAAGKHILCEKPLATTMDDGRAMVAACHKAGVKLQTAFPVRYCTPIQHLKEVVSSGQLGRILAIAGTNRGRNPGGWFIDKSLSGGGAVMDHTVHVADIMRWLTGSEVVEVYAEIGNLICHQDFDDMATLSLTFADGAFGTLDPSWSRPKSFPYWGDVTLEVIGTNGVVGVDTFGQVVNLYSDKDMTHSYEYWGGSSDLKLVQSFVRAVADDTPVDITGEDGLAALEITLAAYESAKRGEAVKLPLN